MRGPRCPKCHCPFSVTKGAADLPTNYFTASVVSSATQNSVDPNNVRCQGCEEKDATEYCQICSIFFCGGCKKAHLVPKVMSKHQFISIDEAFKEKGSAGTPATERIVYCSSHPQYEVNSYCNTDQVAVCAECVIDSHVGHSVQRLEVISEGFKEAISALTNKVSLSFLFFHLFIFFFSFLTCKTKSTLNS